MIEEMQAFHFGEHLTGDLGRIRCITSGDSGKNNVYTNGDLR